MQMEIDRKVVVFENVVRGRVFKARVRVVNKGKRSIRVRVKHTRFPNFAIKHTYFGSLAPNLGIYFEVHFLAHALEPLPMKIEDSVAVVCEDCTILLPIVVNMLP